ncbi:MFS transporter [Candidatus Pelagibacter sp.]|nr:MFS transporter [Candidatus Pelagibacter sp.]MDC0862310.1 MFS transporter [bacterium]MDC0897684.1 MFS transporter [Candidatus Pelagibacter sp.]MDC0899641.1 MFS transporter [Candidatus Pelagibacter sp.]MDC1077297.1 MFS transporter [Candidatus Pelagibacter sp.]
MFNSLKFKVILFGFIFTFFSSFGQSYFLGLFNSSIREALSITHGQFGSIYASATLCSSVLLIWVGKKIDDVNIFKFAFFVIILLSFACFFFSRITSVFLLFVAIFLMRFSGQGMMSHTASTTISRYFTRTRGRALSISWFGLSSAEFIMPVLMVYLLTIIDWQNLWLIFSITVLIVLPIASFLLIKNLNLDSRESSDEDKKNVEIKQWKRREVIKDYRFYIISSNMLAMPWIFTGFAVFQSFIQTSKGWGPYVIAQSFMSYSILSVLTLFLSGFLIDKFTSRKLLIYMNIPLLLSVIVLFFFDTQFTAFIFLGLVGISNGFANILGSSTWAELYGVKYLGSIKALTTALMVFATAFGTALFGYLIDLGFTVGDIAVVSGTYIFVSLILLFFIRKKLNPVIV